jgi:hypothetical protein
VTHHAAIDSQSPQTRAGRHQHTPLQGSERLTRAAAHYLAHHAALCPASLCPRTLAPRTPAPRTLPRRPSSAPTTRTHQPLARAATQYVVRHATLSLWTPCPTRTLASPHHPESCGRLGRAATQFVARRGPRSAGSGCLTRTVAEWHGVSLATRPLSRWRATCSAEVRHGLRPMTLSRSRAARSWPGARRVATARVAWPSRRVMRDVAHRGPPHGQRGPKSRPHPHSRRWPVGFLGTRAMAPGAPNRLVGCRGGLRCLQRLRLPGLRGPGGRRGRRNSPCGPGCPAGGGCVWPGRGLGWRPGVS